MRATKRKKNNVDRSFAFFFSPLSPPHFWLIIKKLGFFFSLPISCSSLHSYRVRQRQHTKKEITLLLMSE